MASDGLQSPYSLDAEIARRVCDGLAGKSVFYDGVFKGDYSLAIVNRCLCKALVQSGVDLTCYTPEPDWHTDPLLCEASDVASRIAPAYPPKGRFAIHLRNTWPASTADMIGAFNAYVCFAWEEIELPQALVDRFNRDLDLIMVASRFVRDAFLHSGVAIPVEVVGEGCDHVLDLPAVQSPVPRGHRRRIIHVSSGLPRKGADRLIEAYTKAFDPRANVELVIKTFANPDNVIPQLVREASGVESMGPTIKAVEASYSPSQLMALLRTADVMVAPSRGEGFGLPLAEAMVSGIHVVTTAYGGQIDFCRADTAWLVDYTLSPSRAHVAGSFSVWADPSVEHLAAQMRAALDQGDAARQRSSKARALLQRHFTWAKVAARVAQAVGKASLSARVQPELAGVGAGWSMDLVSTWREPCGIATYAGQLYATRALAPHLTNVHARRIVGAPLPTETDPEKPPDAVPVSRLWGYDSSSLVRFARRLETGVSDVIWFQHHPGLFSSADMRFLVSSLAKSSHRVCAITLHSVKETLRGGALDWTQAFHVAFVHSAEDAAALSAAGHPNPVVIPHGFAVPETLNRSERRDHFVIGSFGFLAPHKNIDRLVLAFAAARKFAPRLRLKLLNCVQPNDESRMGRAMIENIIERLGLSESVDAQFDFLEEDELRNELRECDLLVFPYGPSTETATGAVRMAMSADRPTLCSRSLVLRDLWPVSHVLKNDEIDCISEALISLSGNRELLCLYDDERRRMVAWYAYPRVAERYAFHLESLLSGTHEYRNAA